METLTLKLRQFFLLPPETLKKTNRLFFLDGFRSLALFFMVLTHGIKTWINPASETPLTIAFKTYITRIPAPSFFFLVGAAYVLSRNARLRRGVTRPEIFKAFIKRSLFLFVLAYVYKLVDVLFGVKLNQIRWTIDVLNVISIALFMVSTWDYLTYEKNWNRFSYFPVALCIIAISPYMFLLPLPESIPLQIRWYIQGIPPNAYFTIFPFTAYSFFGAYVVERFLGGDAEKPFLNLPPLLGVVAGIMALSAIITRFIPTLGTMGATLVFYMQAFTLLLLGMLFCHFFQKHIGFGPLLIVGSHTMLGYWVHAKMVFIYYKQYIGVCGWGFSFWLLVKTLLFTFFLLLVYDQFLRARVLKQKLARAKTA